MDNVEIYSRRVRKYNIYDLLIKKNITITNFYISLLTIFSIVCAYKLMNKLYEISNFKFTIDLYLSSPLWIYTCVLMLNILALIFGVIFNNFKHIWFYVFTIFIFLFHISFLNYNIFNSDTQTIVRNHYLSPPPSITATFKNIDNDDDNIRWKNMVFKIYCSDPFDNNIQMSCINEITNFMSQNYRFLKFIASIICISLSPLLFSMTLIFVLTYKMENSLLLS